MTALGHIVDVATGYTLRGALPLNPDGPVRALQAGDLPEEGPVDFAALSAADLGDVDERFRLREGDVAFRSRGHFRAACYEGGSPVVPLAPLLVLRLRGPGVVLPQFLALFLNAPSIRRRMAAAARGSSIRFLGKAEVEDMEVPVPPLKRQRAAIAYHQLVERERELSEQLFALRRLVTDRFVNSGPSGSSPRSHG